MNQPMHLGYYSSYSQRTVTRSARPNCAIQWTVAPGNGYGVLVEATESGT